MRLIVFGIVWSVLYGYTICIWLITLMPCGHPFLEIY